ncbi:hypothetical protein HPB50_004740 [Hyalomma asiaticum]|uniref:Uncharacterized protein n=1 Tax=Hyalomma asiaticum TaxID=266040 RepID=A0ACB7S6I0_HYAAI|nr:hypothetical protein HPB50_004740 [Hyalomma asiaticum]
MVSTPAVFETTIAGLLSATSQRRTLSRRRSDSGGPLLKKQSSVVRHEGLLLSRVPQYEEVERHRAGARARRSIVQLASMLKCVSGCNPLSYRGYGCFCGYMGDGTPVDHIDSCCLEHDWCYSQSPCSKLSLYLLPYDWHCLTPGLAHCAHPSSLSPHAHCGQQLCQCDLEFANCVSRYPCPRRRGADRYNNGLLYARGPTPTALLLPPHLQPHGPTPHKRRKVKGRRPPGHPSARRPGWRYKRPRQGSTPWTSMWFPTSPSVALNKTFHGKARPYAGVKKAPASLPTKTEHERSTQTAQVDPRELPSLSANVSVSPPVTPGPQYELQVSDAVSAGTATVKENSKELSTVFPEMPVSSSTSIATSSDVVGDHGSTPESTSPVPQRRTALRELASEPQATFIRKKAPLYTAHSPGTGFFLEAKLTKYPKRSAQNSPTKQVSEHNQEHQTPRPTQVQLSEESRSEPPQMQSTPATPTSLEPPLNTTRRAEHTSAVALHKELYVAAEPAGDTSSSDKPMLQGLRGAIVEVVARVWLFEKSPRCRGSIATAR